jgi:chromatin remodeling complex protein RSC6
MISTPYTYYLYHKPTGLKYYGSRWANKVSPENDLWINYFSSSKKVNQLIEEYGKDSFHYEIRKLFATKEQCLDWETKFLTKVNAVKNKEWINRHNGGKNFINGFIGKKHTLLSKQKIANSKIGKPRSEEVRLAMCKPKPNLAKTYKVIKPDGTTEIVKNLYRYCLNLGFQSAGLAHVIAGRRKHYKGYKAEYYSV